MIAISNSNKSLCSLLLVAVLLSACEDQGPTADAYGNFEATDMFVSSELAGKLVEFSAEEGQWLEEGDLIAMVDTSMLVLQKQQLLAQIEAILSRTQQIDPQLAVFDKQLANLQREQKRVQQLLADSAATPQTLDELTGQIEVVKQQREATLVTLSSANRSISQESEATTGAIGHSQRQDRQSLHSCPSARPCIACPCPSG